MDVEKRINSSLDAIIKQGSKKGKSGSGKPAGPRGRGKVRVDKLSSQGTSYESELQYAYSNTQEAVQKRKGREQEKKLSKGQRLNQSLSKTLGVQKKKLKVQSGSRRPPAPKSQARRDTRGGKAAPVRSRLGRRAEPAGPSRKAGRTSKAPSRGAAKRTVDLPRLTDLRITISNTQASSTPAYPATATGAPGFQSHLYQSQPMWGAPAPVMAPQPAYGFGPRNMQPRESYSRAVPDYPVPRAKMDFGVSRRVWPS